ncbi:uncharacterized protein LOC123988087 [Osmia bicornis bicornis]|uniref:uncharacterized protein LOC123988087 n=1 Tax=Osmia bicornis bicornis TaxID=1437191 RepID=UPI001EAEA47B|nr:uncharacterized protein LOC123988087 [Osmia bicornis bicornis]
MSSPPGTADPPSFDELFRRFMEMVASGAVPTTTSARGDKVIADAIPDFCGTDLGEDANQWCDIVEKITEKLSVSQRLSLATHALTGAAKKWYKGWEGNPRTWATFRDDLCSVFVPEDRLCERLSRAVEYTSDSALSYSEYARNKLKYYGQTQIDFKQQELISLVIGHVMDATVRQSLMNARYETTSDLLSGISNFVKVTRKGKDHDTKGASHKYRERGVAPRKRCYQCNETGHLQKDCPKKRKVEELQKDSIKKPNVPTCSFCSKRGHVEGDCWIKKRSPREERGSKRGADRQGGSEVNACFSVGHKLSPVILQDMLVKSCLMDCGATCSLIKERVAKRANCKIVWCADIVKLLSGSTINVVGYTTAVIQTEEVAAELDILVVSDDAVVYDLIIGKNIGPQGIKMTTDSNGETKLERCSMVRAGTQKGVTAQVFACDGGDHTDETRGRVEELLERYKSLTPLDSYKRCVNTGEINIKLKEDKIIHYHPYRLSITEREKVREVINELLLNNVIRESTSPFASPIILVKKKNGKDRMCVDFRALNRITIKDRYPLPLKSDQLDRLSKGKYFTILDMASGFYQIPVAQDSIEKTAFVTPDGHYEFLRMPFGLANAPGVFQRAINKALGTLRNSVALVYIDDVLIPTQTVEEGLKHLELVLQALDAAGFSLNLEKCKFLQTTINYLGREVSAEGVRPGKDKVKALLESPVPNNVKQVRQFMGLASYFRKFIPEFALVPLKTLSGDEMLQIFKERLTLFGVPQLVIFDRGTNFTFKQLQQFIEKHGSIVHYVATGAPRANGQAERYVATVTNLLTVEIKKFKEWPNKLAKLMLSLNTTVQKTTGFSPYRLLFGLERGTGVADRVEAELPDTNERINVNEDRDLASVRLAENAVEQNTRFDKKRRDNVVYKEGDTVFVKPADLRRAKLESKYLGPFVISKVMQNDHFEVVGKTKRPQTVPKDRMKLWKGEWSGDIDPDDICSSSDERNVEDEPC